MTFCLQLKLLLHKNWLVKKRRPRSSICELLLPVFIICILLILRAAVTHTDNPAEFDDWVWPTDLYTTVSCLEPLSAPFMCRLLSFANGKPIFSRTIAI